MDHGAYVQSDSKLVAVCLIETWTDGHTIVRNLAYCWVERGCGCSSVSLACVFLVWYVNFSTAHERVIWSFFFGHLLRSFLQNELKYLHLNDTGCFVWENHKKHHELHLKYTSHLLVKVGCRRPWNNPGLRVIDYPFFESNIPDTFNEC